MRHKPHHRGDVKDHSDTFTTHPLHYNVSKNGIVTEDPVSREKWREMKPVYDRIGPGYSRHRCADPRIVEKIVNTLGLTPPGILADIGAGTGNYSRAIADLGFRVKAVEPSEAMLQQAVSHNAVDWYKGTAEDIPLPDHSVDGVFCILASHHFSSLESGAAEMARICSTGPLVWLTFDPRMAKSPWINDYFPEIWERAFEIAPPLRDVCHLLEIQTQRHVTIIPWPVPHDLHDRFIAAAWRMPAMYLDPEVRAGISAFALAEQATLNEGLQRLKKDIENGRWQERYCHLLDLDAVDWGYRFLKAQ
jgi:ubiquinone/menaquinone biosynthesis C-methylase UbiE